MAQVNVDGNGDILIKAINSQGTGTITLSADVIDIDGIVQKLRAVDLYVATLEVGGAATISADLEVAGSIDVDMGVTCDSVSTGNVITSEINNCSVSWQTQTVVTGVSRTSSFTFKDTGGTNRSGSLVTGVSTTTISYLGGASS
jgi:hypothetical protein